MLRRFALTGLLLLCGCPDSSQSGDTPTPDGGGAAALTSCVERPSELPRPPTDRLPCELIPPDLTLPATTR
jgi:hypothetical protein